jgi:hypothetical protein
MKSHHRHRFPQSIKRGGALFSVRYEMALSGQTPCCAVSCVYLKHSVENKLCSPYRLAVPPLILDSHLIILKGVTPLIPNTYYFVNGNITLYDGDIAVADHYHTMKRLGYRT